MNNLPTQGQLELNKTTDRGYSVPEAGATFEVYSTAFASYADAPASCKDTITTNDTGYAITKSMVIKESNEVLKQFRETHKEQR